MADKKKPWSGMDHDGWKEQMISQLKEKYGDEWEEKWAEKKQYWQEKMKGKKDNDRKHEWDGKKRMYSSKNDHGNRWDMFGKKFQGLVARGKEVWESLRDGDVDGAISTLKEGYHGIKDGYHGKKDGYYGKKDGYYGKKDGYYGKKDGYYGKKDGYYGKKDGYHGKESWGQKHGERWGMGQHMKGMMHGFMGDKWGEMDNSTKECMAELHNKIKTLFSTVSQEQRGHLHNFKKFLKEVNRIFVLNSIIMV